MRGIETTSRTIELIIGCIGGFIGLISCSLFLLIGSFGSTGTWTLGTIAMVGSLLGLISSVYVLYNNQVAGILLIISTILVIIGAPIVGVVSALFLLIAGILALFRK